MADAKLSAAFSPAHALPHPMANPGYGKRDAPDQLPRTAHDFAHLPPREAAVAAYIDRLPRRRRHLRKDAGQDAPVRPMRTPHRPQQPPAGWPLAPGPRTPGRLGQPPLDHPNVVLADGAGRRLVGGVHEGRRTEGSIRNPLPGRAARPAPARTSCSRRSVVRPRRCPSARRRARNSPRSSRSGSSEGRDRRVRTPGPDGGPPRPGPQPGGHRPHPPHHKAPTGTGADSAATPTPPRTGVREVRHTGPPGGPAGRHLRPVPGRSRARPGLHTTHGFRSTHPRRRHPHRDGQPQTRKPHVTQPPPLQRAAK
jgi:hypothetical protein